MLRNPRNNNAGDNQDIPPAPFLHHLHDVLNKSKSSNEIILTASPVGNVRVQKPKLRGKEIYNEMKRAIMNAKEEVLLMGFKLDDGSDGEKDLIDALTFLDQQAVHTGKKIRVRILINRRVGIAEEFKAEVDNAFHKGKTFRNLDFQYAEHEAALFGSYHTKMLVIDNNVGYLPTADLMKSDNYKKGETGWVDIQSILHGRPFVNNLRNDFINAWGSNSSRTYEWGPNKRAMPKADIPPQVTTPELISVEGIPTHAMFLSKKAKSRNTTLSPFTISVIEAIRNAKHVINVMTPNLNEETVIEALAAANKRGVEINIITGKNHNDKLEGKPFAGGTNQEGIRKLFKAIKGSPFPNRLHVRWATDDSGRNLVTDKHPNSQHARVFMADDVIFIGSSVLDKQSVYRSRECDVVMQNEAIRQLYLENVFNPFFKKGFDIKNDPQFLKTLSGLPIHGEGLGSSATEHSKFFSKPPQIKPKPNVKKDAESPSSSLYPTKKLTAKKEVNSGKERHLNRTESGFLQNFSTSMKQYVTEEGWNVKPVIAGSEAPSHYVATKTIAGEVEEVNIYRDKLTTKSQKQDTFESILSWFQKKYPDGSMIPNIVVKSEALLEKWNQAWNKLGFPEDLKKRCITLVGKKIETIDQHQIHLK